MAMTRKPVAWLCAALLAAASASHATPVTFENAWVRAPVPGQTVAAGYCDIVNQSDQAVSIVRFAGPVRVEMHETTHQDGMARMRPLARLPIAANATLSLQPGGKHLMLFGLDAALGDAAGQITLRALFANGEEISVVFAVRAFGGGPP